MKVHTLSSGVSRALLSTGVALVLGLNAPLVYADPDQRELAEADESEVPQVCNAWRTDANLRDCWTPRMGVVSGFYVAIDVGYATMRDAAGDRAGIGPGASGQFRLGMAFADSIVLDVAIGGFGQKDRRPFSEAVVECQEIEGVVLSCGGVEQQRSSVDVTTFTTQLGYQYRVRPISAASVTAGLLVGYTFPVSAVERSVACDGCKGQPLPITVAGFSLAPTLRVTFGDVGSWAMAARSLWYFTGDLRQITYLGVEYGLP